MHVVLPMKKLQLHDVTLVVIDTAYPELTKLAVDECLAVADFGDALAFSDKIISVDMTHHVCSPKGVQEAMSVLWYQVPEKVKTSHFLVIQWDSWIINPQAWRDEFLKFDYIGAPWWYNTRNVGNGGFSLRSIALAKYVAAHPHIFHLNHPEDNSLCRVYRDALEDKGYQWADNSTALDFSFECVGPISRGKHFGFHCLRNWPYVMNYEKCLERLMLCPKSIKESNDWGMAVQTMRSLDNFCGLAKT